MAKGARKAVARSAGSTPFRVRVVEPHSLEEVSRAIARTGSEPEGVGIMTRKGVSYLVEVDPVPLKAAMLLKQEMLALGGDSAHHRDVASLRVESSRALLLATWGQYLRLFPKLKRQPFRLGSLGEAVERALRAYTSRRTRTLRLAHGRTLVVGRATLVMGVVNATPDSFFDGGRYATPEGAIEQGLTLLREGADLIDVGGESTRPGARPLPEAQELRRVIPVLQGLRAKSDAPLSIDTRRAGVARAALEAGADLVNDVSGLGDPRLRRVVHRADAAAVVMHMRGTPTDMQRDTRYEDVRGEVFDFLADRTSVARGEGIGEDQLVVDPGIGFGKSAEGNFELLAHVGELRSLGYPVLVGASRKSFLGAALGGAPPEERLEASIAAAVAAGLQGAEMVRVHDVAPTVRALKVADAVRSGRITQGPKR